MGAAIADYFKRHKADRLRVFSSQFDEDEIPVEELFRTEKQMPLLERTALQMATGRILDVGAGSGCHSLTLQEAGKEVHAIDISPLSVEVMKQRGVRSVSQTNLFNEQFADEYDTILMLMNGSGIIGNWRICLIFPEDEAAAPAWRLCFNGFQQPELSVRRGRWQYCYQPCR